MSVVVDLDKRELDFLPISKRMFTYSDFIEDPVRGSGDFHATVASGGSVLGFDGFGTAFTANHPGLWLLQTGGGSADGRAFVLSGITAAFNYGINDGPSRIGAWYGSGVDLSTPAQRYVVRAGTGSVTLPNTVLFGIFLEYQDDENGGRWQAITVDGGGETTTDTGVTVATSTWYKLEHEVNAAGTEVKFFIDDVHVATNTTNIPAGVTYDHFLNVHIMKVVGIGTFAWTLDAAYVQHDVRR